MDTRYNGWANYATWRVNLEVFDGLDPRDWGYDVNDCDTLAAWARDYAEAIIDGTSDGIARDYALSFLSDVNWREIAEHMADAYADSDA